MEKQALQTHINAMRLALISLQQEELSLVEKRSRLAAELEELEKSVPPTPQRPVILLEAELRIERLKDEENVIERQIAGLVEEPPHLSTEQINLQTEIQELGNLKQKQADEAEQEVVALEEEEEVLQMLISHLNRQADGISQFI